MTLDSSSLDVFATPPAPEEDDRTPLAMVAGIVAALVAGGIWAALVFLTDMEIGWVAWGIGGLVGLAMSRVTVNRTRGLAVAAAALAVLGLAAGKAFIFMGSSGMIAESIQEDPAMLQGALAWQMYEARELQPGTLEAIDAAQATGDTVSNDVWAAMTTESSQRLDAMSADERQALASTTAQSIIGSFGLMGGITAQITPWDLLWLFLAVSTAFRMMAPEKRSAAVPQPAARV